MSSDAGFASSSAGKNKQAVNSLVIGIVSLVMSVF
jgi:hypothetical protein